MLRRILEFTIVRIVIAVFVTALAGGLTTQFVSDHTSGSFHVGWPDLCGAVAALGAYTLYVRLIERRPVAELAGRRALEELALGLAGGAVLVGLVVGSLAFIGVYHFEAINLYVPGLWPALAQMAFIGVFEELLTRAIVFRLLERSLGTWIALAASSLLFGLAHMPGNSENVLAIANAVIAGVFFGAAYLATRRLWLGIALHTSWNFTLGDIFSISVSGRPQTVGLISGSLDGPPSVTGGAYGLEGSISTLVFLLLGGAMLLLRAIARRHVVTWAARRKAARQVLTRVSPSPTDIL